MRKLRRLVVQSVVAILGTATALTAFTSPASAADSTLQPTTWAFTDSSSPKATFLNSPEDLPIGTFQEEGAKPRSYRSYVTFDISQLRDQVIHRANFYSTETSVTNCDNTAPFELWRTTKITNNTSWKRSPKELEQIRAFSLGGPDRYCPGYVGIDLIPVINAALARHEQNLTLELRIAKASESDPGLGRRLRQPGLNLNANHVPTLRDLKLISGDRPCGTLSRHPKANNSTYFSATVTDADGEWAGVAFAIWPVDQPDQRREFGSGHDSSGVARGNIDLSGYPDGTVLAWAAQADDYWDTSAWTEPCYLTIDKVAPTQPPVITSPVFLDSTGSYGGPGVPAKFRFDSQGDRDVVAYRYSVDAMVDIVQARRPGRPATIEYTPRYAGPHTMEVTSLDEAGNQGPTTRLRFWVRDTAPAVTVDVQGVGLPSRIRLTSQAAEVTSFGYQVTSGPNGTATTDPETRVPAVAGVGEGQLTFPATGTFAVTARSYAGEKVIGVETENIGVTDWPDVTSDSFGFDHDAISDTEGTVTFRPRSRNVVAYLYNFGNDPQRIDAASDGTAVVRWTPPKGGWFDLSVRSVHADGSISMTASYQFTVIEVRPTITTSSSWPRADGVGVPLELTFDSQLPDVAEFVYQFDDGAEQTVQAESGYANVTVIPDHAGATPVVLRARRTGGTLTPATTLTITISSAPVTTLVSPSPGNVLTSPVVGRAATITFRPGLPGVTEYRYTIGYGTEFTVGAGPDGSASVTYTPTTAGYQTLKVSSVSADGTESEIRQFDFIVLDPKVSVYGYRYGPGSARGGIGIPGDFSFSSRISQEIMEYRYRLNDGVQQTVAAPTPANVIVSIAPDRNGDNVLRVQSVSASGELSPVTEYHFNVGTAPRVVSADYPESGWGGKIGVAGTFEFSGGTAGVVSFDYQVDGGASTTVAADVDGRAQVSFTPAKSSHTMVVKGRRADGTLTDATSYTFYVRS